jgi:hypothetical protein
MLGLPQYVFPICMLVFGYPTPQQLEREYTPRFDEKYILFENRYRRLNENEFVDMFAERQGRLEKIKSMREQGIVNVGQATYVNKFSARFSLEMRRSVRQILKQWLE